MELNFRFPFGAILFLILILIGSACAPAASMDNIVTSRRASPTPSPTLWEFPVTLQSTQSASTQASLRASLQARLAVIEARARIIRNGDVRVELQHAQSAARQIVDGIEIAQVAGQPQPSYSILYLPDFVNVELFASTKMFLADARQGVEDSADVTLDLETGHMFVHLNNERATRVTVRTPYATIKTLTNGAEFDVCHNAELTCVMVKNGIVEIVTEDRREIIRSGSAGVVSKDQSLSPVICAPVLKFIAWEERYRLSTKAAALQEEIAELPQKPCPVKANGFPWNARILYRDEFSNASRGWDQGTIDNFMVRYVRYAGARYYQVQAQEPQGRFLAFVPNERDYEDVNIDLKTRTEAESNGDFFYGLVFRRSGNKYYAFILSPPTGSWYFLKSTSNGLKFLRHGIAERMRGLEGQDTLRVETYGSTFLVFINGRFIDWISDSEYARGEVGLFVETIDNPDAMMNFNSIFIWDIPTSLMNPDQGENCFNARDDDGDGQIDQVDPDCQGRSPVIASSPTPSPRPTSTPRTVRTPTVPPPPTDPPAPTATNRPPATQPPAPTATNRPPPATQPPLPLPTLVPPLPTLLPPLPTLPLPIVPPVQTPTPR